MASDMISSIPMPANLHEETLSLFFDRLRQIFADMDQKYGQAAAHYEFHCNGCEDNCCLTRFHHHTYLEYLFIRQGFDKLAPPRRQAIRARAEAIGRQTTRLKKRGAVPRLMCPLNEAGLCRLYAYRPMICRLHGLPHELQKPGQPVIYGPGCETFDERCSGRTYYKFDRTPFYFEMAELEREFKQAVGLAGRIKVTIAEMIVG